MNRDEREIRIADYLDGLLDEEEAREVEAEMARDPGLAAGARRLRAVLYHPYPVAPPPEDLPRRVRRRFAARPFLGLVRYAAVFVAGALTMLVAQASLAAKPAPVEQDAPPPREAAAESAPNYVNLRIR